jgi:hypothetical protein
MRRNIDSKRKFSNANHALDDILDKMKDVSTDDKIKFKNTILGGIIINFTDEQCDVISDLRNDLRNDKLQDVSKYYNGRDIGKGVKITLDVQAEGVFAVRWDFRSVAGCGERLVSVPKRAGDPDINDSFGIASQNSRFSAGIAWCKNVADRAKTRAEWIPTRHWPR